jgi:two-component system sensor histidine kinase BaeS
VRARISAAILGSIVAALVLTGLGTLVLDRLGARSATESELRDQAEGLATLTAPSVGREGGVRRQALGRVLRAFELEGMDFVFLDRNGRVIGDQPQGVAAGRLDPDRLLAGETLSGHDGRTVYALAPAPVGQGVLVAVLTRSVDLAPGRAFRWFVVSAAVTLVAGAAVAVLLSRALTRRLRAAEAATHRIAAGDLSTRLAEPPGGAHDELSDLARSINTMAEGLERSRGLEQQFLLSVSHDLRTPLTSIRGYAEAIGDGTAEAGPAAGIILGEAQRLERLVADLLDLARLDARRFRLDPRPADVGAIVAAAVEGFRPVAERSGITLDVADGGRGAHALVDPDRLAQVVANLLENGCRHAATQVRVLVATAADPAWITVSVEDDGGGIAAADLPHVFERLYVARHQPVRRESGSGLGLAIVRELVTAMGGQVAVDSPVEGPGRGGTRLSVRLPRSG